MPLGPLLMVNPRRRRYHRRGVRLNPRRKSYRGPAYAVGRKTGKAKFPRKTRPRVAAPRRRVKSPKKRAAPRRRKVARKRKPGQSPRRTRGGVTFVRVKKGRKTYWREMPKRRRNPVATRKRRRKRRRNPLKRKRRKNPVKRVKRRRRRVRRRNPAKKVRRRRRRRNVWLNDAPGHRRAAKKGWRRRYKGVRYYKKKRIPLRSPWTGRKYKRPKKYRRGYKGPKRKAYAFWKNPNGVGDIAIPLVLASIGFIGSYALLNIGAIKTQIAKLGPDTAKFIPVALPIGAAVGLMMLAPKVKALAPYTKHIYFAAFGLALAGGVAGIKMALAGTEIGTKLGLSGYVVSPMRGYVRRPFAGYVAARGLGQIEQRARRTLGAPVEYRGGAVPAHAPGIQMQRALGTQALAVKPYGLGLPQEERRYNEFAWRGVYDKGTYE